MRPLLAAAAIAAIALLSAVTAGAQATRTRVWVSSTEPLVVRGSGFVARERVHVVVTAGGRFERTATAAADGSLVVRFRTATVDRCLGYTVRAVGDQGSHATITPKAPPECAPLQPANR
jgi:hypothetical protein